MNTIGTLFRVTTWGESHGKALGVLIDGCPPGLEISEEKIQKDLDRRKPGQSGTTARHEEDKVEILSGVFEGRSLGTPISMLVRNHDAKPEDYKNVGTRPGHADFTYEAKFGIRDPRGGGRSSGRETVARVMAGAVAREFLKYLSVKSYIRQIGTVKNENLEESPTPKMLEEIEKAQNEGDSLGGIVEIHVTGLEAGIGSPVFGKLEAQMAKALMSVGAVKGFEFGEGFNAANLRGSEHNSRPSGGSLGGISDGTELILRVAVKPPSSIAKEVSGRHDVCIVPRIPVILESMVLIVLADLLLMQRAQNV
ncbi:chorismate synthase [Patescibacteria group bacterium]|nr:chorismate synthase [Patescibacteria group bacterium]